MSNKQVRAPLGQVQERFDIKGGMSRAMQPHQNDPKTWWTTNNFRFYKNNIFTVDRKAHYVTTGPTNQTITVPSPTCLVSSTPSVIPFGMWGYGAGGGPGGFTSLVPGLLWEFPPLQDSPFNAFFDPYYAPYGRCARESSVTCKLPFGHRLYNIRARVRGVVEWNSSLSGGTVQTISSNASTLTPTGYVKKGGTVVDTAPYYRLIVDNPSTHYDLNFLVGTAPFFLAMFDYVFTFQAYGDSTLTLYGNSGDSVQLYNNYRLTTTPGFYAPYVFDSDGIQFTQPYGGQMLQLDIVGF